jgi:hypothetical protein
MAIAPDLEALARYLDSDLSPGDCMRLSDLDGFLTAVVICRWRPLSSGCT